MSDRNMTHVYEIWDDEMKEEHRFVATIDDAETLADILNTYYDMQSAHVPPRFTVHSHKLLCREDIDHLGKWTDKQAGNQPMCPDEAAR